MRIAIDVSRAMDYLHTREPPLAHLDLKSLNILISSYQSDALIVAKVADFGLTRVLAPSFKLRNIFNPTWVAVEVLKGEQYNEMADVYSYAIVLYELYTRQFPFHEYEEFRSLPPIVMEEAIINGLRPSIPASCPPHYASLISRCWDENPSNRPTFDIIEAELTSIFRSLPRDWAPSGPLEFMKLKGQTKPLPNDQPIHEL